MRLRVAVLVAIVVAAAVVLAFWPRGGLRQTLRDGSRLTLSSVKVGRTNTFIHGPLLSRTIGPFVPSNGLGIAGVKLQRPSKVTFPADDGNVMMMAELRLEPNSTTNNWVKKSRESWRHRVVISGDDGFPHVHNVREFQQYPEGLYTYIWARSFPRQSRSLRFRLEERDSYRDEWRLMTTFETRNPKRFQAERWAAQKTAVLTIAHGVQVEIGEITIGSAKSHNDFDEHIAKVPVRFSHHGVVLTNWAVMNGQVTDATGNYGWLHGKSATGPISDGWRTYAFRPLDPKVPWRLHLDFSQESDFPETNLLSFSVVWPLARIIYTNVTGKSMHISFNNEKLVVGLVSKERDTRLTFVSATDDSGADLYDFPAGSIQHMFGTHLKLRQAGKTVGVNATVAIHPIFTNEVILQPRLVSR